MPTRKKSPPSKPGKPARPGKPAKPGKPKPDTNGRRIDHVVVLMLENRSFDHLLGFRPGVSGLTGSESNLLDPSRPKSATNPAITVAQGAPFSFAPPSQGPGHSFNAANVQLSGSPSGPSPSSRARNNGYVKQYTGSLRADHVAQPTTQQLAQVMQSFSPAQLPSLNALAGAFTVCDHWFSEVPGPTQPNRLYMHAATSIGQVYNNWSRKFDVKTIYNSLQDAGFTWAVYWTDDNEVAEFNQVSHQADNFKDYGTHFVADARAGRLPNYTFIEPQFGNRQGTPANSQHPPNDARHGDRFIADVYEALRANEAAWARTLLVVTYDEHGGFYDHVAPPSQSVPNPDGLKAPQPGDPGWVAAFAFDRLGVRVPTVLASPWIDAGVESRQLQHTSLLATVKKLFGLPSFLTRRDASATAFDDLISRRSAARTDTPRTLPRAPIPAAAARLDGNAEDAASGSLDATQQEIAHGAHALTSVAAPADEPLATTQHEASLQMQRRMTAYLQHRKQAHAARGQFRIDETSSGYRWTLLGPDGKPVAEASPELAQPRRRAGRRLIAGDGGGRCGVHGPGPRQPGPSAPPPPASAFAAADGRAGPRRLPRQLDHEARPVARRRAHGDGAAVLLHHPGPAIESEGQRATAARAAPTAAGLIVAERVEERRQIRRRHVPYALDRDGHPAAIAAIDLDAHPLPRLAVLDGVGGQVGEQLQQPVRVPRAARAALGLERELGAGMGRHHLVDHLPPQRRHVVLVALQGRPDAEAQPPHVDQLADHPVHALAGAHDAAHGAFVSRVRGPTRAPHRRP